MRRELLVICFIFQVTFLIGQPELSLLGSRQILQADLYNPAWFHHSGWHLGLPSIAYNFYHTGPGYRSLIDYKGAESPVLRISTLKQDLEDENFLYSDLRIQTFKMKYGNTRWNFGFDHEIIFHSTFQYPGDLVRLYLDGNQQFIGQTIHIAPQGQLFSMNSYGFLLSHKWSNFTVGVKPRILFGQHFGNTPQTDAKLTTSSDIYQISLATDYRFDNVGLVNFTDANFLNYQLQNIDRWRFISPNVGLGLDWGLDLHLSDAMNFSFSMIDWGFIKWSENIISYHSQQTTIYDGLEVVDLFEKDEISISSSIDSLKSIFRVIEEQNSVKFRLPAKYTGAVHYNVNPVLDLALVSYFQPKQEQPVIIGLQAMMMISHGWKFGAAISNRYEEFNLGVTGIWTGPRWISYFTIDQLLTNPNPVRSNHLSIRLGVNVHLQGTSSFN